MAHLKTIRKCIIFLKTYSPTIYMIQRQEVHIGDTMQIEEEEYT